MSGNDSQLGNEKFYIAVGVIGLALIVLLILSIYSENRYIRIDDFRMPVVAIEREPFEKISLTAKAAIVWDVRNEKFLYQKKSKDILPLASLAKLMTALAVTELVPKKTLVQVDENQVHEKETIGLLTGERWDSDVLTSLTLFSSSNIGARAIATVAGASLYSANPTNQENPLDLFVKYLNMRAGQLGMYSTRFYNDSGLDISENKSGAYGSAKDMSMLIEYIINNKPGLLEPTRHSKLSFVSADNSVYDLKNTNIGVESVPGIIGSKTGFTDLAQGNLAIAFSPGLEGPYIIVVLGSTLDGRFDDVRKLVSATMETTMGRKVETPVLSSSNRDEF